MTETQALLDANERIADLAKRVAELEAALHIVAGASVDISGAALVLRHEDAGSFKWRVIKLLGASK